MLRERWLLAAGFLLYTVIFLAYYPPTYAIVDEASYLSTAYSIQHGTFYYDRAGINQEHVSARVGLHQVSRYPPGNSLLLLPFTAVNWRLAFLRGWLLAGLGLALAASVLRHYRLPESFALLFLLHPTVVLYSRTIMSDFPAMVFVLGGVWLWLKKKPFPGGLILGLSAGIRFPNLLVPAALVILALARKEHRPARALLAGAALGLVPLAVYHQLVFGTVWGSAAGYGVTFNAGYFPVALLKFAAALLILYPLMPIAGFWWPERDRWIFLAPALATIGFYSLQGYSDRTGNLAADLVTGLRYLLPAIPLLLIPYIGFLNRFPQPRRILPFAAGLLLIGSVFLSRQHQRFLARNAENQRILYQSTRDAGIVICNKDVYELINPYVRYVPWYPFEVMRRPQPLDAFLDRERVYLACLTSDADIRGMFDSALGRFRVREEVYGSSGPKDFSIWRVSNRR